MTEDRDEALASADSALTAVPLRPATTVRSIAHAGTPTLLASLLPGVEVRQRALTTNRHEYRILDARTGSGLRVLLTVDGDNEIATEIAEQGPRHLWDELVIVLAAWERAGRPTGRR